MSQLFLAGNQQTLAVARLTELVNKNGTSATQSLRKREKTARKKLKQTLKEQSRYANVHNLRAVAVTLTYADNTQFGPKHISTFLDLLRRTLKRQGHPLPYVWTLESSGRLHYHLLLWLPRGFKLNPAKLKRWWPWGSNWTESCRSPSAWGRYIAKFDNVVKLPKGARMFGDGGLDSEGKLAVARAGMPHWLILVMPHNQHARRRPGGGWIVVETGEFFPSPYVWFPRGIMRFSSRTCMSSLHTDFTVGFQ